MFRCKVCFYIHEGDEAPEICPKCGAPKEQFETLSESQTLLIARARSSNDLLINTLLALHNLRKLSVEGKNENLDPSCLRLFQRLEECAILFRQMILAEIQSHVMKNKWG